jgi:cytochrome o ubiquinol oxidase subunit 2
MLSIVIPTFILLFVVVWKYRAKRGAKYDPEHSPGVFGNIILWIAPAIVIAVMAVHTTKMTHQLDPYRPITI